MVYRRRTIKPTKPMRVAEVLQGYLRSSGLAKRVGQASVVEEWAGLVGPKIARAAVADSVTQDGTLFVRVPSSAWRQELSLMAPDILEIVNRERKDGKIRKIRWLVGEERPGTEAPGHRGTGAGRRAGAPAYRRTAGDRAPRGEA